MGRVDTLSCASSCRHESTHCLWKSLKLYDYPPRLECFVMSDVWKRCRRKVSLHAMHRSNQVPEVIDLDDSEPPAASTAQATPGRRPADSPQAIPHNHAARRMQHAGPSGLQSKQRASVVIDLSEGEAAAGLPLLHRRRDHLRQGSRTASAAGHAQARNGLQGPFNEEDSPASLFDANSDKSLTGAASFAPKRYMTTLLQLQAKVLFTFLRHARILMQGA